MEQKLIIRGRHISFNDISLIHSLIHTHKDKGRTFISRELSKEWHWYQPNGALKDMACREILRRLEQKGLIDLPLGKNSHANIHSKVSPKIVPHDASPIEGILKHILPIELKMIRSTSYENLFKTLIHKYHYLGYNQTIGPNIKYIAFSKGHPLACLSFGAAAWKVACRDSFIGWSDKARRKNLHLLLNNHRFLILPWVKIPYLASYILSQSIKLIPKHFQQLYHHPIVLLETFVDTQRFKGICYKASNWLYIGLTKGRGKWDKKNQYPTSVKAVFIYPLIDNFTEVLCHE